MQETRERLDGLGAEAEIRVDRWGVPHIRAASERDLFFAQGFNAARDRLWQIDLWRKRGLGRLAASFGPGFLAQDRAARAFLYRGDMAAEWVAYGPGSEAICTAFAEGVNACVALIEAGRHPLPREFVLTDSRPERWAAGDVVRIRTHALGRNAASELKRARILASESATTDLLRNNLEPPIDPSPSAVPGAEIPEAALDLFRLATAPVTFPAERLAATMAEEERWTVVDDLEGVVADEAWTGSNNWAVAGTRTVTGRPVVAGDPHRLHALPSLRYLVHLTAPGLDVIGAGEPSMPGVSMGHNGHAAFTQTIFGADQEDVVACALSPDEPDAYAGPDGPEPIERVAERFEVRGEATVTREIAFTRHGPVLHEDRDEGRVWSLRTVWSEPGTGAYLGGLTTMRARSFAEFREGLRRFATPSLNHVYGDASGAIGWQPAGMTPRRAPGHDGLTPVSGDGVADVWQGFHPLDDLPSIDNPAEGWVRSANEFNIPAGFDHEAVRIGHEWLEAGRARRIAEVLAGDAAHDVAASQALQTDTLSEPGLRLKRLLAALPEDAAAPEARAMVAGWDGRMTTDTAAGALIEIWWTRRLKPAVFAAAVSDPALIPLFQPGDVEGILLALESPEDRLGLDPAARDALLTDTLAEAAEDAAALLGSDPSAWRWGDLHHGFFEHPLAALEPGLSIGPLAKPGSASTVMHAAYRGTDFRVTHGASVRFVIDVGNWDASVCINAPGQSGDPDSPHYADLAPLWAQGEYVPMLYGREAVDAATETRIVLQPA